MDNEKNIKEQALNLLKLKTKLCLMNLASDISIIYDYDYDFNMPEEVNEIKKFILEAVAKIDDFICEPPEKKKLLIDEIDENIKKLKSFSLPVYMNLLFSKHLVSMIDKKYEIKTIKDRKMQSFSAKDILQDCTDFLSLNEGNYERMLLLSCFPPLISMEEYSGYIHRSFEMMLDNIEKSSAQRIYGVLKLMFAPFKTPDFSKGFPYLTNKLEKIFKKDFSSLSEKSLDEIYDIIEDCDYDFTEICSELEMYFNDLHYILGILIICVGRDFLFDDNFVIKDIYYSLKSLHKNPEFAEELNERVTDIIEDMLDTQKLEEESFNKSMSGFSGNFSPDVRAVLDMLSFADENYKTELFDDLLTSADVSDENDKGFIKSLADDFIKFIKEIENEASPEKFDNMKQMFFLVIPCPLSDDELMLLVRNILDNNKDEDVLYITFEKIRTLLNS